MKKIIILSICYTLLPACSFFSGNKEQTEMLDASQPAPPTSTPYIPDRMQCALDKECYSGICEHLRTFTRKKNVTIPPDVKVKEGTQVFWADITDSPNKVCIPKGTRYCSAWEHNDNMEQEQDIIVPKLEKNQEHLCIVPSQGPSI